jgi:urea transport system substrate-binding protein
MKSAIKTAAAVSVLAGSLALSGVTQAADTIKVGILHSLSGTMAINETALKDVILFAQKICNVITL